MAGSHGSAGENAAAVANLASQVLAVVGPAMKAVFDKIGQAASHAKQAVAGGAAAAPGGGQSAPAGGGMAGGMGGMLGGAMRMMNSEGGQAAGSGISSHLQHMAMMQPGGGFGTNLMAGILPNLGKAFQGKLGPWGEVAGSAMSLFLKTRAAQKQQAEANAAASGGGAGMPDPTGGNSSSIATFNRMANQTASSVQDYSPETVRQYQRALKDLNAVFGRMLTPVMETFKGVVKEVSGAMNALTPHVKPVFEAIRDGLKPFIALGGGVLRQIGAALAPVFDSMAKVIPQLAAALKPVAELVAGLVGKGVAQVGRLVEMFSTWLPKAVAGLTEMFERMRPAMEGVGEAMGEIMEAMGDAATTAFGAALDAVVITMKAMAPVMELLAMNLRAVAKLIEWTAKGFARFIDMNLKAAQFLGLSGGPAAKGPMAKQDADGLSAQSTGTTSVGAMLQQLRERAFAMGGDGNKAKDDPAKTGWDYVQRNLAKDIGNAVWENVKKMPGMKEAEDLGKRTGDAMRQSGDAARLVLRTVIPGVGMFGV